MTQTMIADDAAAIAQAMKDLGLEKSVPAVDRTADEAAAIVTMSQELNETLENAGWQIHDDGWQRLAQMLATANSILEELEWVEGPGSDYVRPMQVPFEGRWRDLFLGAGKIDPSEDDE